MGQTTLHYLRENLFDIIKIDGSLVKGLSVSSNTREIVASLVELAESLSLQVIAEFVETVEEKELLHQMGCDQYQGYLYSPAVPLVEDRPVGGAAKSAA
jgi:EAL domain-containing protein (putative c-di-GMP-specific phosphodiesterase class I)